MRDTGLLSQFRPLADSAGPSTWVARASEQGLGRGTFRVASEAVGLPCGARSAPRASEPGPAPPSRLNLLQKHTLIAYPRRLSTAGPPPSTPRCPPALWRGPWLLAVRASAPPPQGPAGWGSPVRGLSLPRPGRAEGGRPPPARSTCSSGWGWMKLTRLPAPPTEMAQAGGAGARRPGQGLFLLDLTAPPGNLSNGARAQPHPQYPSRPGAWPRSVPDGPTTARLEAPSTGVPRHPSVPLVKRTQGGLSGLTRGLDDWGGFASN